MAKAKTNTNIIQHQCKDKISTAMIQYQNFCITPGVKPMASCNVGPIAVKFQWPHKNLDTIHQAKLNCIYILLIYSLLTALDMCHMR